MKKLILRNFQSPGDIVMLTAAVRDLHAQYPRRFLTDVRTPCPQLWENNPHITAIPDGDREARIIDCHYPLIHRSNQAPYHFVHGFSEYLGDVLGMPIRPTRFKGDIHLAPQEKSWISQIQELLGAAVPFWIVNAGGKFDFTIKWWDARRYQRVVDHFRDKLLFVQVGEMKHHHPRLEGTIDLRGKTDLRQLVRLVYHAEGVLGPVSLLMHLAAAVETKPGALRHRAGVIVAGGREPPHWEAYPHHQFLHTMGALRCCDDGGCWRSRTVPLRDGDPKDQPGQLCLDVVDNLPRCMDLVTADAVIAAIETYYRSGARTYLSPAERALAQRQRSDGHAPVPAA